MTKHVCLSLKMVINMINIIMTNVVFNEVTFVLGFLPGLSFYLAYVFYQVTYNMETGVW
jgi:hypothetical protein